VYLVNVQKTQFIKNAKNENFKTNRRQVPLFHLPMKITNNYFVLLDFFVESPENNAFPLSLFSVLWMYNPLSIIWMALWISTWIILRNNVCN